MIKVEKLLKLADFLENKIPRKGWKKYFNLNSWAEPLWPEKKCNSTACAMGWATVCFPSSGLKLKKDDYDGESYWELTFKGYEGFTAAAVFFGISIDGAIFLFDLSSYAKGTKTPPYEVSDRIRVFVNGIKHTPLPCWLAQIKAIEDR